MKFCRSCGSALATTNAALPGMPPPGPMASPPPMGGGAMGMMGGGMPPPAPAPSAPIGGAGIGMGVPMGVSPSSMPPPPAMPPPVTMPAGPPPGMNAGRGGPQMIACPRCGTQTPVGFAYCQQCGLHMGALQPTDPGAGRPRSPSSAPSPVDAQAATMVPPPARMPGPSSAPPLGAPLGAPMAAPSAAAGPAWGAAVLVNRDGSDGQRFQLAGDTLVIGRAGADIAFDDDRFLARQHARIDRAGDGSVKITAIDTLNGVFRKAGEPVDLVDGTVILVGREVLRFETISVEEKNLHPMVRHGVALFGSPPREPWGRLLQLIPSGGHRDVRHLMGEEVVLGREEGDVVYRDDAFMSRRHAAITWNGTRAQITDLGSSNGTFVKVATCTLKHGDHVRMGDQLLRIEIGR